MVYRLAEAVIGVSGAESRELRRNTVSLVYFENTSTACDAYSCHHGEVLNYHVGYLHWDDTSKYWARPTSLIRSTSKLAFVPKKKSVHEQSLETQLGDGTIILLINCVSARMVRGKEAVDAAEAIVPADVIRIHEW